ncbi:hypothetical protein BH11VER1_BH11VER1_40530 [soil metagenome]
MKKYLFLFLTLSLLPVMGQEKTVMVTPTATLETLRDSKVVELFQSIPVQEAGRIKPLDTVARFKLLRFSGKQSVIYLTDDSKSTGEPLIDSVSGKPILNEKGKAIGLNAMEWMLVSWFRPDIAKDMQVFVVDNSDAVIGIGLQAKSKRDRYSYNDLLPGRQLLMKKMQEVRAINAKDRDPSQRALAKLSLDYLDYEMMLGHFDFARSPFGKIASSVPAEIIAPTEIGKVRLATWLPKLSEYLKAHPEAAAPMNNPWFGEFYRSILGAVMSGNAETVLRIFPPSDKKEEIWQGPGPVLEEIVTEGKANKDHLEMLSLYEDVYLSVGDGAAFKKAAQAFHDHVTKAAAARGESGHVAMEISYHQADYFYYALIFFVCASLSLALSWVATQSLWGRLCRILCWLTVIAGALYGITGVVIRCIIMQRPPITTLYETILFITLTSVTLALVAEWMTKKGLAVTVACIAGTAGMFLSIRFMNMEGSDTLQQLQAVLITNFWLSTHVPCINLGYAAGMVAAIFSMIYFMQRLVGKVKAGDAAAKDITRIAYGFVMAGLFLSLVGTVLGGIWANYSWGRFWGWDPKENGALMIVLMNLIILHARLGGYIREVGFHACNLILGMIVAFSWFGTNQLGVGLHAYGFTDGVWKWLYTFWGSQTLILFYAVFLSFKDRHAPKPNATVNPAKKAAQAA